MPRAKVVAVCTTEPNEIQWATENQEYRDFGIRVYGSYDEMLTQPGLQAVDQYRRPRESDFGSHCQGRPRAL